MRISFALAAIGAAIAERQRQEGQGGKPPFQFLTDTLQREGEKLRLLGQPQIADGILALRQQIGAMDND